MSRESWWLGLKWLLFAESRSRILKLQSPSSVCNDLDDGDGDDDDDDNDDYDDGDDDYDDGCGHDDDEVSLVCYGNVNDYSHIHYKNLQTAIIALKLTEACVPVYMIRWRKYKKILLLSADWNLINIFI